MKKWIERFMNLGLVIIVIGLLYFKAPGFFRNFGMQGESAPNFQVITLNSEAFDLQHAPQKMVLVFWATWCGPCDVELGRINKMIAAKELRADSVLAVSIGESPELLKKVVQERAYLFPVAPDVDYKISSLYGVNSTPTVVFVDENKKIRWLSSGLSPTLGLRLGFFL